MKTQEIIDFGERVWRISASFVPQKILDCVGRMVIYILFLYSDVWTQHYKKKTNFKAIPRAGLRYRVWGDPDIETFLASGRQASEDIKAALGSIGKEISSFQHIFDFGCGCGRIFIFLKDDFKKVNFYATDTDKEAIRWCAKTYKDFVFNVNKHLPPLDYASERFDLIMAIAVFRHLSEEDQFGWLAELQRVLKPGGIMLVSLHGEYCWKDFPVGEKESIEKKGYLFKPLKDPYQKSVFPGWYQAAYHSKEYVIEQYSKYFEILKYIPQGVENETDMVVLKK